MIRIIHRFVLSGLLMAPVLFTACGGGDPADMATASVPSGAHSDSAEESSAVDVVWGRPMRMKLSAPLRVTASVEVPPQSLASVHSPVAGYVQTLRYLPGDYVRKGALLCTLTHPELVRLQREYLETRARLQFLEGERARKEQLAAVDAASQRAFEQAAAEYEATQARVQGLRTELQLIGLPVGKIEEGALQTALAIHAPVSGYVAEVAINRGKLVQPEDLLYEIVDDRHVHLELQVFAKDLPRIRKGQRVWAFRPGTADTLAAEVHLISHKVDPGRGTALVHAHFEKEPVGIAPGTVVQALVLADEAEVWALPEEAVLQQGRKTFVLVRAADGHIYEKEIRLGRRQDGYVEWSDYVPDEGLEVALKGAWYLKGSTMDAGPGD